MSAIHVEFQMVLQTKHMVTCYMYRSHAIHVCTAHIEGGQVGP